MHGELLVYHNEKNLVAFVSPPMTMESNSPSNAIVLLGGLTDGLMALPCVQTVQREFPTCYVIQPLLSSSYLGYGIGSLNEDAEELNDLVNYLEGSRKLKKFTLIGHSTGANILVRYASKGFMDGHDINLVLQGAVSDRQYLTDLPETSCRITLAKELVARGKEKELMPRDTDSAPITAERCLSFTTKMGDDDMFSSDVDSEYLESIYRGLDCSLALILSGKDEYVIGEGQQERLIERLSSFKCFKLISFIPEADHAVSSSNDQLLLCNEIRRFMQLIENK